MYMTDDAHAQLKSKIFPHGLTPDDAGALLGLSVNGKPTIVCISSAPAEKGSKWFSGGSLCDCLGDWSIKSGELSIKLYGENNA